MNARKIVKKFIPKGLFAAIEPYGHLAEAIVLNTLNGFPGKRLKVIGVTGTNGKTTTTFLIHRMLHEAGYKVGMLSTVAYGVGDDIHSQIYHMTTVPVPELMKRLKWMRDQGAEWLVLETTSHALAQNRVWGVPYSIAVMTNVTHEHLDYHKTFERYRDAKRKLFQLTNANKKGQRIGIINAEDPSAELFASDIANPMTYGVKKGDLRATQVKSTPEGSTYTATIARPTGTMAYGYTADGSKPSAEQVREEVSLDITINIPGSFNVYNSLAAAATGLAIGLSKEQIEKGIAALRSVEGRMTNIEEGQDFTVIVDFAHTPDSFEKLFKDLRPMVKGRLIALFGSAGRRDESKRAIQGELAGKYCDEVIVTEEDDRDVDGQEIMNQIAGGAEQVGKVRDKDLFLVHDRTEAINFAMQRAKKGDTVILLGKGHEKTIERADGEHPWDEIATAKAAAKKRLGKS
ncbi:MAG TPA: UDP-N-acetylmuramoyl-L-alanyl-D-glutamate--2,6-diaminopimelate ligase [Candidatus Saccharimonadales bacterium]|nr:UDP-N-acetylmuramoyl-L-alanyl-D-glutamate--2,6-diaminopimelate ligase [Candidatus Saccharimonadales bacterium]